MFVIQKKGRDKRQSVHFEGRLYRNFNEEKFRDELRDKNWDGFYKLTDPAEVWDEMFRHIISVLDVMCPVRHFHIKKLQARMDDKRTN